MVVTPSLTLSNKIYQIMRKAAIKIIRTLDIHGGCNVQFALDPKSNNFYVIEVNPRVSRSSALASKATGYTIAKLSALIAIGKNLNEIVINNKSLIKLSMGIGRTFNEAFLKAYYGLAENNSIFNDQEYKHLSNKQIIKYLSFQHSDKIKIIFEALRRKINNSTIINKTLIHPFFIGKFYDIVKQSELIKYSNLNKDDLLQFKRMGFSDENIVEIKNLSSWKQVYQLREKYNIFPNFKSIDSCSGEINSELNYYYSTYDEFCDVKKSKKQSILIIGGGPIKIGQGLEFDYCTVQSIKAVAKLRYESIILNNNPETVSTDMDISDKLYFEPVTHESILNIYHYEKIKGVIFQFGGQTAINQLKKLEDKVINLGTSLESIDICENRIKFNELLTSIKIIKV